MTEIISITLYKCHCCGSLHSDPQEAHECCPLESQQGWKCPYCQTWYTNPQDALYCLGSHAPQIVVKCLACGMPLDRDFDADRALFCKNANCSLFMQSIKY